MRSFVALSLVAVAQASTFKVGTIHKDSAPVLSSVEANVIPDSYIIKFKDHVDDSSASDHHTWIQELHKGDEDVRLELRKRSSEPNADIFSGMKHSFKIGKSFKGYAGHFHESVIEKVRNHPDVSPVTFYHMQ